MESPNNVPYVLPDLATSGPRGLDALLQARDGCEHLMRYDLDDVDRDSNPWRPPRMGGAMGFGAEPGDDLRLYRYAWRTWHVRSRPLEQGDN